MQEWEGLRCGREGNENKRKEGGVGRGKIAEDSGRQKLKAGARQR